MNLRTRPFFLLLVLLAAAPGPLAHAWLGNDSKKCTASAKECETQIRKMLAGQKYLGVHLADSEKGIVVRSIMPESPAWYADLRVGDILTGVEGRSARSMKVKDIKPLIDRAKSRGTIMMIVRRGGALDRADMRFAVMGKEQLDKIVAAHLKEAHIADESN